MRVTLGIFGLSALITATTIAAYPRISSEKVTRDICIRQYDKCTDISSAEQCDTEVVKCFKHSQISAARAEVVRSAYDRDEEEDNLEGEYEPPPQESSSETDESIPDESISDESIEETVQTSTPKRNKYRLKQFLRHSRMMRKKGSIHG